VHFAARPAEARWADMLRRSGSAEHNGSPIHAGEVAMITTTVPDRTEAADYYFTYIDQVGEGDIREVLESQAQETLGVLGRISEEQSVHRYAPDKWSIRQVMSHVNDTERAFVFRALWFARGFDTALPSFDQNIAIAGADADARSWRSHVDEFQAIRGATLAFFQNLPVGAWPRRGIASGNSFTVNALAYITAGHVTHHMRILQERYL
jgi:hypothetical protein